jgi:rubrerythrin
MIWALEAEKTHAVMYAKAKEAVDSGKDAVISDVYICDLCGYTTEGIAPDKCPLCNASKNRFKKF